MRLLHSTYDAATLASGAEMDLASRYTGGFMTEAEARHFEARLEDPEFFDRVAPLIKLWYKRRPLPVERETAQRIRGRRQAGLPLVERSHIGTIVAATTVGILPFKALGGVAAAATILVAVGLMNRSDSSTPAQTFVHVTPAKPNNPLAQTPPPVVAIAPTRKTTRPVVVAVNPIDPTASMVFDSIPGLPPLPGPRFMPSAQTSFGGPQKRVAEFKIDTLVLRKTPRWPNDLVPHMSRVAAAWAKVKGWLGKVPGFQKPTRVTPIGPRR